MAQCLGRLRMMPSFLLLAAHFFFPVATAVVCFVNIQSKASTTQTCFVYHRSFLPRLSTQLGSVCDRRSLLQGPILTTLATCCAHVPPALSAEGESQSIVRPYAPLEALLPAARVKVSIDRALRVTTELTNSNGNARDRRDLLEELEGLLLTPQNFTVGSSITSMLPSQPAKQYLDSYRQRRDEVPLLAKPGALLVQRGEIDAWKRLKRQERTREDADEVRAALNAYTSNLNFDPDRYALTARKEERSRLIREDRLPDVKTVIASDMGVRYLYRNELLTAMDEARAELRYQLKAGQVDATELRELLTEAQSASERWFSLIDEKDVRAALEAIREENEV